MLPCAVVVGGVQQEGQHRHQRPARRGAYVGVGERFGIQPRRDVQQLAEQNAQPARQRGQHQHPGHRRGRHGNGLHQGEGGGFQTRQTRHAQRRQRRHQTGHQRRVVHSAHRADLQREHHRRQRRAENGGKHRRHAAHGHHAAVGVIQTQQLAQLPRQRAAQQQPRALPSGGAAEQMGDDGGNENQRRRHQRHDHLGAHRHKGRVHRPAPRLARRAVHRHDAHARQRQQPDEPRVGGAGLGGPVQSHAEGRSAGPHQNPHQHRQRQPFDTARKIQAQFLPFVLLFHTHTRFRSGYPYYTPKSAAAQA